MSGANEGPRPPALAGAASGRGRPTRCLRLNSMRPAEANASAEMQAASCSRGRRIRRLMTASATHTTRSVTPLPIGLMVPTSAFRIGLLKCGLVAASIPHFKSPILNALVGTINPIGSGVTLLVVCVALAVMSRRIRRPRLHAPAAPSALAFASAGLIEFSLKHLVGRPRPDAALASAGVLGPSFAPDID